MPLLWHHNQLTEASLIESCFCCPLLKIQPFRYMVMVGVRVVRCYGEKMFLIVFFSYLSIYLHVGLIVHAQYHRDSKICKQLKYCSNAVSGQVQTPYGICSFFHPWFQCYVIVVVFSICKK